MLLLFYFWILFDTWGFIK